MNESKRYFIKGEEVTEERYLEATRKYKVKENEEIKKKQKRIHELEHFLKKTDYKVFKYMDKEISDSDYKVIQEERKKAREEINALETEIKAIKEISKE